MGKAEITRQYIIERTAPIFNMKGYAATSMSDLTNATGLTKGSIYGNFKNKEEVALEAFYYNLKWIIESFSQEVKREKGAVNRLLAYVRFYKKHFLTMLEHGGCPILNTAIDAENLYPDLKLAAANSVENWRLNVEKIIDEGIKYGEIEKSVDAKYYSGLFFSLIEGSFMTARLTSDKKLFDSNMNYLSQMIRDKLVVRS